MAGQPPAVCSFQLSAELSFELIVEIFISRCCFRGSLKPLSRADCVYTQNTPPTFPQLHRRFSHTTILLCPLVMAQDLREKREKATRMKQPYFQSLNNQEWEEIILSYHK